MSADSRQAVAGTGMLPCRPRCFISMEAHLAARMALTSYIQLGLSQLKTSLIGHLRPSSPPTTLSLCVNVFTTVFSPQWRGLEKLQNLWSCLNLMRTLDQCFPNLGVGTRPLELGAGPGWARLGQGLPGASTQALGLFPHCPDGRVPATAYQTSSRRG